MFKHINSFLFSFNFFLNFLVRSRLTSFTFYRLMRLAFCNHCKLARFVWSANFQRISNHCLSCFNSWLLISFAYFPTINRIQYVLTTSSVEDNLLHRLPKGLLVWYLSLILSVHIRALQIFRLLLSTATLCDQLQFADTTHKLLSHTALLSIDTAQLSQTSWL
jgi:hypothetical protein